MTLRISPDLDLPIEAITETFAFLAKRGAGKTYAASVLAEEMLSAGAQVIVLDPLDVWWGLRSSADGKGPGLPIAIFGGEHGDIPLEPTAGAFVADLVVSEQISVILVVDQFSKGDQRRFAADFGERLFRRNREPLHLILEEADRWAPQRPIKGEERMLGAYEEIVRRGRSKGLGCTLVTQRSAVLHKDVLTQTEVLVAMRTPSKHDRRAIEDWFDAHEADRVAEVMASVPSLPTGTAWVSSPYWLGALQQVRFRARQTFDSSSTPEVGRARREARTFADIDLAAVKEQMAATIERAREADPKELRRRITELERALHTAQSAAPETVVERVEVPVFSEDLVLRLEEALSPVARVLGEVQERLTWEVRQSADAVSYTRRLHDREPAPPRERAPAKAVDPQRSRRPSGTPDDDIPAGPASLLRVLAARYPAWLTRSQVVTLAKRGPRSSSLKDHFAFLLERGLIERDGTGAMAATDAGLAAMGEDVADDPIEAWRAAFSGATRRLFDAIVSVYPERYTRDGLADLAGLSRTSSSVGAGLADLRRNGLIEEYPDGIQAADILFEGR